MVVLVEAAVPIVADLADLEAVTSEVAAPVETGRRLIENVKFYSVLMIVQ